MRLSEFVRAGHGNRENGTSRGQKKRKLVFLYDGEERTRYQVIKATRESCRARCRNREAQSTSTRNLIFFVTLKKTSDAELAKSGALARDCGGSGVGSIMFLVEVTESTRNSGPMMDLVRIQNDGSISFRHGQTNRTSCSLEPTVSITRYTKPEKA